jgi:hypothetical protein
MPYEQVEEHDRSETYRSVFALRELALRSTIIVEVIDITSGRIVFSEEIEIAFMIGSSG